MRKNLICYECDKPTLVLSSNSRCMACTERRAAVNEDYINNTLELPIKVELTPEQLHKLGRVGFVTTMESREELDNYAASCVHKSVATTLMQMAWNTCLHLLNKEKLLRPLPDEKA